jgi:hypothetical protein
VRAGIQEGPQPSGGERDRVGPRDAGDVKTLRARESGELDLDRGRVQKSRLA